MVLRIFDANQIAFHSESAIPSMLSKDEEAFYYHVARSYTGSGTVCELGSWLGSGTYHICRGLADTGHPWRLTTVDRFRWSELYEAKYGFGLKPGESFLPRFEKNISEFLDRVTVITAELADLPDALRIERGIELLFVDAPKSWRLLWHVMNHIAPHLVLGARLLFQDFLHITSRQIVWLLMSIPALNIEQVVRSGTAALFTLRETIPNLEAVVPGHIQKLTVDDFTNLWERVERVLPEERLGELAAGMALDLMERNADGRAMDLLEKVVRGSLGEQALLRELARLARHNEPDMASKLSAIEGYLRSGKPIRTC